MSMGPVVGGAGTSAAAASKPLGITKLRAWSARGKNFSNDVRIAGVLSTRAALRLHIPALDAPREPLRHGAAPPARPGMRAPGIAIVDDQRPAELPRDVAAGQHRRMRRRGRDDHARRQIAGHLESLARGGARPEVLPSRWARARRRRMALAQRCSRPLPASGSFTRFRAAMHMAGERQRIVGLPVGPFARLVSDHVHVVTLAREFARQETEALGAHGRAGREPVRNDEYRRAFRWPGRDAGRRAPRSRTLRAG